MQYVNCSLCGSNAYKVLWDKTEREKQGVLRSVVIRDKERGIVQGRNVMCKACGLVYVSPRMSEEELKDFYKNDYRKVYGSRTSLQSEKNHANNAYMFLDRIIEQYETKEAFSGKMLDIGCSTGRLLEKVKNSTYQTLGLELYGIEPNMDHCVVAKNAGLNVLPIGIEDYNPGMQFDIITMLNTLEHVADPAKILDKIHGLLSNDGHFLVSVPNLLNTHINIPVDAFLSNAHLYNFTPATLGMMMRQHGFKLLNIYLIPEEMGEKVYILAQKSNERVDIVFDDNIDKRIELTKMFLRFADELFLLKNVLMEGIR